ncbi:MAG: glycogen debranching enzyme [Desulfofustis sp.]|nr:glycogen debranching enzyme [Desulfofustis sp.]
MTADHFQLQPGNPLPLGTSRCGTAVNFAFVSRHAETAALVLRYDDGDQLCELNLDPALHRTGDIWHASIDTGGRDLRYGYRIGTGTDAAALQPDTAGIVAVDPYCRDLLPRAWGVPADAGNQPICLSRDPAPFDWQGDRSLKTPASETIIYELHVRGFTRHPSSRVTAPGTFRGVIEKIPYLKDLGITAIEVLPITEWDETDNKFYHPKNGNRLLNYWGYNPLSFFALRSGLAAAPTEAVNEFKSMVRSLHAAGIEIILDLVFNHTGESDRDGTTSGFRAIDNDIYYLIDREDGGYLNYSGCGNTVSTNHPVVRRLIVDALRHFVSEFHVDGFRFDLAAVFSRDTDGTPIDNAPLIEEIAEDPLLRDCKLIAEAWDASGLYQVGSFSRNPRWMEWNGKFRDDVRAFMAGHPGSIRNLATRIAGSSDLYKNQDDRHGPLNSVNYVTCHDGFTLYDLVSYDRKHNHENGEQNRDGDDHSLTWNSGFEGAPGPAKVERLRQTRMRTLAALLFFSQGVPMICSGDEWGRTQEGNNNAWCQDNEISWLNWNLRKHNDGLFRFFRECIRLRSRYRLFRRTAFFPDTSESAEAPAEIIWQGLTPGSQDWSDSCLQLGFLLNSGAHGRNAEPSFLVLVNGSRSQTVTFTVPDLPEGCASLFWLQIVDTGAASPFDIVEANQASAVQAGSRIKVEPMTLIALQSGA